MFRKILLCAILFACFVGVGYVYSFLVGDTRERVLFMSKLFVFVNGVVFVLGGVVLLGGWVTARMGSRTDGYEVPGFFTAMRVLLPCYASTLFFLYFCVLAAPVVVYVVSIGVSWLGFAEVSKKLFELRAASIVVSPAVWLAWFLYSTRPASSADYSD